MLRETSALPSCSQCDDVSLCLGMIIGSNSVDVRVECFIMTPFGCRVMRTSRAVKCVSTETRKNVTNHRGQFQNKQFGFERTCPTCAPSKGYRVERRLWVKPRSACFFEDIVPGWNEANFIGNFCVSHATFAYLVNELQSTLKK